MIQYVQGNILETTAKVIVNPVNTVGVMGKGLALHLKNKYPNMFKKYQYACDNHLLSIGVLMLCKEDEHWILLFPTKIHWKNPSKIEYIEAGLQKFVSTYRAKQISSIAFPKIGCGNGGLDWEQVSTLIESYLREIPIDIYIYI